MKTSVKRSASLKESKTSISCFLVMVLFGITTLVSGCNSHDKTLDKEAAPRFNSPQIAIQPDTVMPRAIAAEIKGQEVISDNFAGLKVRTVGCTLFELTQYSECLAGVLNESQPDSLPDTATMVWLARKLETVPCVIDEKKQMCGRKRIVDAIKVPAIKIQDLTIVQPENFSCSWHDSPVQALLTKPIGNAPQFVFAAWQFDLAHEKIIPVPPNEVTCQDYFDEEARWTRGRQFWHGWDFDTESGMEGLHQLGKVIKEENRQIEQAYGQAVADIRDIQYEGLLIRVAILPGDSPDKKLMQIVDVEITSPLWPVKYGLVVGSTKEKVKNAFGHIRYQGDNYISYSGPEIKLPDGSNVGTGVRFELDKVGKITAVKWHMDDTNGKD